jgi:glycosidase
MTDGPGRVSFLDNHDMDRFLWVAGSDVRRLKMAALCQFTLSPTPVLYYGTEIGLTQAEGTANRRGGDAEARRNMVWNPSEWNRDLLTYFQALIRLRRAERALHEPERRTVHLDASRGTYAYRLDSVHTDAPLFVAFNLGAQVQTLALSFSGTGEAPTLLLATGETAKVRRTREGVEVELPAMTAALVRPA